MPAPRVRVRFGEDYAEALCGMGALREAVVLPLLPAELYAEIPGNRLTWDEALGTIDAFSPGPLHALLAESGLFREIALRSPEGAATGSLRGAFDLTLDAAAPRDRVVVYARSKAEAVARHIRTLEPGFAGEVPLAEAAWDRTATAAKAMMDGLLRMPAFRGRPGMPLFPGRDARPHARVLQRTVRAATAWGREARRCKGPFVVLGTDPRDYPWQALGAALARGLGAPALPLAWGGIAPATLVGLLADPECLGYVGDGYPSYAAWALEKPLQVHLVREDPLWNAIRAPRGVVVSTREELEQKFLPGIERVLDFVFRAA